MTALSGFDIVTMSKNHSIKFTLLTACKNEEVDIRLAIESALDQTHPNKEIIFVDDSTDRTPDIIREYANRGVILIDGPRKGCCQARNLGMQRATGDVIVFLTADTKLEPDYLEKIAPYYEGGYDWVVVDSLSFNLENVYSRFVEMQQRAKEKNPKFSPWTTQGYSVRRDAALAVGMISGGVYPVNFCRDWSLGKKLEEHRYKKIFDRSIAVPHKSPDNFPEYWIVRKTRGLMSAYQPYFMFHESPFRMLCRFAAKSVLEFLRFVLIIPAAWHVAEAARESTKHSFRDFFLFYYAYFIQQLARVVGEWQGWLYIWRHSRTHRPLVAA